MILNPDFKSLSEITEEAGRSYRVMYAMRTCWWAFGSAKYKHLESDLPSCPRGSLLMQHSDALEFIAKAQQNPGFYGKYGISAFVLAFHGNLLNDDGWPTSLQSWDDYNYAIEAMTDIEKLLFFDEHIKRVSAR